MKCIAWWILVLSSLLTRGETMPVSSPVGLEDIEQQEVYKK